MIKLLLNHSASVTLAAQQLRLHAAVHALLRLHFLPLLDTHGVDERGGERGVASLAQQRVSAQQLSQQLRLHAAVHALLRHARRLAQAV